MERLPNGQGSGEQWVRDHYSRVVDACRHRQHGKKAETGAIVLIDADRKSVNDRQGELREALAEDGMQPRAANERIVHWIPKWSIETWIKCLNSGRPVTEDETLKGKVDVGGDAIRTSAETFYEFTRPNMPVPAHWTPSLVAGADESKRM
jgi:hypothetical protein